ncbi:MAG: tetratricopeptide repeat protein, partial [Pseudomonadota bacterium]
MPLEPFSATWFGCAATSAFISMFCRESTMAGLRNLNTRLSRGRLDPNHHIARAARLSQLNAAIVATKLARDIAIESALDADPARRAAGRGADASVTKNYDKALRALNKAIPSIDKEIAKATKKDDGANAYEQVDEALSRLLAAEQGNAVEETNAELCKATLEEVKTLGDWDAIPEMLTEAFTKEFGDAFAASLGAILKKDDDVFRIWLVLKQQATDDTLQDILAGLTDLSPHTTERDEVAIALAKNAEALEQIEGQLADLSGLAVRTLEEIISVKMTGEEIKEDVKELIRLFRLFKPQLQSSDDASPSSASHPPIYNVTGTPNRLFTGRKTMLGKLDKNIRAGTKTAITAVKGMGGIGKTSLAREYVFAHGTLDRFAGVWWIPAETPDAILSAYEDLAEKLEGGGLATLSDRDIRKTSENTMRWLAAQPADRPYLIVLDNAPTDKDVKDYVPGGTTKVIITTRFENFSEQIARPLNLDLWNDDTTARYLHERIGRGTRAQLRSLAGQLHGLPLAAEQAGAYLAQNSWITPAEYEARLIDNLAQADSAPLDYDQTVYGTFSIALDALMEQPGGEAARGLLDLIAWLSPDGVPLPRLQAAAAAADNIPEPLRSVLTETHRLAEALSTLRSYALLSVRASDDGTTLSLHRLVAAIARHRQEKREATQWRNAAIMMINRLFPGDVFVPNNWPLAGLLTPHAIALADFISVETLPTDMTVARDLSYLSNQAGLYLRQRGNTAGALSLLRHSLAINEKASADEPLEIAKTLSNIATILGEDRETCAEAEAYYERALEIKEQHLAKDDPSLATTLSNFGGLKRMQGQFVDAVRLTERAANIAKAQPGGDRSGEYAIRLSNLGSTYHNWFRQSGDPAHKKLERLYKVDALTIKRHAIGLRNSYTAIEYNNNAVMEAR